MTMDHPADTVAAPLPEGLTEPDLTDNARSIFDKRYSRKDADGSPTETPVEATWRVASNVAAVGILYGSSPEDVDREAQYPDDAVAKVDHPLPWRTAVRRFNHMLGEEVVGRFEDLVEDGGDSAMGMAVDYYEMIANLDFVPNSPTWTGAGTPLGQLAACFVLPIEDDLASSRASIFETMKVAAAIQQTGGGNGFHFGGLRPKSALVSRSMGKASGPIGFMAAYSAAFEVLAQGGSRRGANMATMVVTHPDIRDFIEAKTVEGEIDQFNISVMATREFMDAVEADDKVDLSFDGTVYATIDARELFDEITSSAWMLGDPGMLFVDRANEDNPVPQRYTLEATNPCITGETWVMTSRGPAQASVLEVLDEFSREVIVNGEVYDSSHFFETGVKPVFILTTSEGYRLRLTEDHQVMTTDGWREAGTLTPGDKVVLHDHGNLEWEGTDNGYLRGAGLDEGYLLGLFFGDGTFGGRDEAVLNVWETDPGYESLMDAAESAARRHIERVGATVRSDWQGWSGPYGNGWHRMSVRAISDMIAMFYEEGLRTRLVDWAVLRTGSSDLYRGFLRGLFDADGHIEGGNGSPNVRLSNSDLDAMHEVQQMLLALGIYSRIYPMKDAGTSLLPDGNGGMAEYEVRASWRLVISGESAVRFRDRIGFSNQRKREALESLLDEMKRGPYRTKWEATFEALVPDGEEMVYDVKVPGPNAFDANGLYVHNCGEQWLGPYENCCLGSINLRNFVRGAWWDGGAEVDWFRLADTIHLATRFLDDVVDANQYVESVPELAANATGGRRIGLGGMGLADMLVRLGIRYGSEEAQDFAASLMEFIRFHTMRASVDRAAERGAFPWICGSIYDPADLKIHGPGATMEIPGKTYRLWSRPPAARRMADRPALDWSGLTADLITYGIRNSCQNTWAPTGTISNYASLEGSGCEPFFALGYTRWLMQDEDRVALSYLSPSFREALVGVGVAEEDLDPIIEAVMGNGGSCQGLVIPSEVEEVFVVAADVAPAEHVRMQAALQRFTDNSISKTINLPNEATVEDVAEVYRLAYETGCKGITIYRTGSREVEVLQTSTAPKAEPEEEEAPFRTVLPMPLPDDMETVGMPSRTYKIATPQGAMHVTVTELDDAPGRPFDVRVNFGKAGNDKLADVEAIGRLVSLALRAGIPVDVVIDEMRHIGGASFVGFGKRQTRSVADALSQLLARRYAAEEASIVVGDHEVVGSTVLRAPVEAAVGTETCPDCHRNTLIFADGCLRCEINLGGCGDYSGCS